MSSEIDEIVKRVTMKKGVEGVIVINSDGIPIRTSVDEELATIYAGVCSHLASKAKQLCQSIDKSDQVRMVRFRSRKHEILLAPDGNYLMIVIQNPSVE